MNILCFLTPDSEAIIKLKRDAIDILIDISDGYFDAFKGYQGPWYNEYVDTYLQTAALMIAMSDSGVLYSMDPYSINGSNQHIAFPSEVLQNKSGLCIETSLVIASALLSANMHPYLVFPTGHAQVAVETWEGSGEYFLIETTRLPNDWSQYSAYADLLMEFKYDNVKYNPPITYLSADEWVSYINERDVYILDCRDGSLLGLTPFVQ